MLFPLTISLNDNFIVAFYRDISGTPLCYLVVAKAEKILVTEPLKWVIDYRLIKRNFVFPFFSQSSVP